MVRIAAAVAMRQRRKLIMAATSWICGGSCYFAVPIAHRTSTKLLKDDDDRLRFGGISLARVSGSGSPKRPAKRRAAQTAATTFSGIPLLFQVPGMPMAFFASGDVRLYLGVPESPDFRSEVVLYFTVTDIDAEYERLQDQHGLSFTGEPHVVHRDASGELWMTFIRDPDEHWIGLMQQRESSSAVM
jgi:predicted enzyme related to lactoylglutathione lyase